MNKILNNKTPGPDGTRGELVKWLDKDVRDALLKIINKFYDGGDLEELLNVASVASIYKKVTLQTYLIIDQSRYSPLSIRYWHQ